ncbi:MAG: hypothetical protein MJ252_01045 [archaeon]|nr:hypothetical protein [archaeon]
MDNKVLIDKLVKEGNNMKEYQSSDYKLTLRLYKNGFLIQFFPKEKEDEEDLNEFYNFSSEQNKHLFERIKENQLPKEIIPKVLSFEKVKKLCLVIEDYSKEDYFKVDNTLPKTKLNIKLLNGQTIIQEYNVSQTINNIKESLSDKTILPKDQYTFATGFPPIELDQSKWNKSIQELKLENATLFQRIVSIYNP